LHLGGDPVVDLKLFINGQPLSPGLGGEHGVRIDQDLTQVVLGDVVSDMGDLVLDRLLFVLLDGLAILVEKHQK